MANQTKLGQLGYTDTDKCAGGQANRQAGSQCSKQAL